MTRRASYRFRGLYGFLIVLATVLGTFYWSAGGALTTPENIRRAKAIVARGQAGEAVPPAARRFAFFVHRATRIAANARMTVAAMYIAQSVGSYTVVRAFRGNILCYQSHALPGPPPLDVVAKWRRRPRTCRRAQITLPQTAWPGLPYRFSPASPIP